MRHIGCIVISLWVLAGSAFAQTPADPYLTPERQQFFIAVQRLLFDDRFAQADSVIAAYRHSSPLDPAGILFQAGSLVTQMTDREEEITPDLFKALIDSCLEMTDDVQDLDSPREQAWRFLIRGHAHAYRSIYSSHFGSFTAAIDHGFDAKGEYQNGLKADSTLYDLYFGLGSYHYWKSAKAGFLRWIGIFNNDKAKGIRELQLAADSSLVSREAATNALIWVYFDNNEFDSAKQLVDSAMLRYPNGKAFLWPLAKAQYELKDYAAALATYRELRLRLEQQPGNFYNLIECDYYLTKCHDRLKQDDQAISAARQFVEYYGELTKTVLDRQRSNLSYLRKIATRKNG
ncbi:MAG: hypothetical protein IPH75_08875 [bacterium]|nr:hypothetical protein [bacterium]